MISLKDKIVCITGASAGIGAACAAAFAEQGAALVLSARRSERVEALAQNLRERHGVRVHTGRLDVRNQKEVQQYFDSLPAEWQEIDILVNNAGLSRGLDKLH